MTTVSAHATPTNTNPSLSCLVDIVIVAVATGLAFLLESLAYQQGWLPYGTQVRGAIAVVTGACVAVAVVLLRGGSWHDLGLKRPARWARVPLQVVAILVAFLAGQSVLPGVLSLFFEIPAPDFSRYDVVRGNLVLAIGMALVLPLTASIPEEIIYRGFLMGRLTALLGKGLRADTMTVLVQAVIFSSIHFQWGVGGMLMTFIMGIIWGTAFLWCGRNLWVVILAHSGGHMLFVTQLYLGQAIVA